MKLTKWTTIAGAAAVLAGACVSGPDSATLSLLRDRKEAAVTAWLAYDDATSRSRTASEAYKAAKTEADKKAAKLSYDDAEIRRGTSEDQLNSSLQALVHSYTVLGKDYHQKDKIAASAELEAVNARAETALRDFNRAEEEFLLAKKGVMAAEEEEEKAVWTKDPGKQKQARDKADKAAAAFKAAQERRDSAVELRDRTAGDIRQAAALAAVLDKIQF